MSGQLQEALSLIEANVKCWNDAAEHIEEFAKKLGQKEKATWDLLAAVYRERAQLHVNYPSSRVPRESTS